MALVCAGLWACAVPAPHPSDRSPPMVGKAPIGSTFVARPLPAADGFMLTALERPARVAPARYRVIVVPGSGCAGMAAIAERYFAGLLHAEVLVLHKPWVDAQASTPADRCSDDFVQADALVAWRAHAIAALRADARDRAGARPLPQLLLGISEGAELLPALAPEIPHLAGLVVIGSSGLDPRDALALQAAQWGASASLQALERAQAGPLPDTTVHEGRSLRYWRELWQWPLAQPLLAAPWPLLQVWGEQDALVPQAAYQRFRGLTENRKAPYCARIFSDADHGLQRSGHDDVQKLWAWLEQWARAPQDGLCGVGLRLQGQ
ncbi:alpha/beta hydrolase [Simplicispira suum]|uniref:Alpha/beta hydrolase n=1 Tax=Simplicispira suum TaxID=2109915 RepID=A0A2S0N4P3_9BURK|nr:alpha/beta hydrolase [Simplicispira suum]